METELKKELMEYANQILAFKVPELLLSRFERTAIKRYEEMKLDKIRKNKQKWSEESLHKMETKRGSKWKQIKK